MEGLIKGLIDVALGVGDNNDDESNSQARDERSRSTWAQVVSGEQDQDEEGGGRNDYNRNQWNRKEENEWRNEESETVVERPSRRPQKLDCEDERYNESGRHQINQHQWNRKEHNEGSNEDWETVGKRPQRQPHKEYDEGSNADWETVGKRPPRQSHKEHNEGSNENLETVGKRHQRQPHKVPMDYWHGYKQHPSEQKYADDSSYGAEIEPSEKELSDLSHACNKLWELDSNCLVPGRDYRIDCGEGKKVYQKEDMAQGSLFDWVNEEIFRKPTYSRFCSLLDNYNPNEGSKEVVTSQEKHEQVAFIEEISRTAPIKYLHKYLSLKGIVSEDIHDFKRMLTDLWFELYGRGGTSGSSSAFEHVFVGEIKNQNGEHEVSGFHNWIQFYLEESKGRVDYQGYIFPRRRGQIPDSETKLLTVQFEWNGVLKSVSSTLVGVSPEFEIALYTLCFYMGGEDNHIELGPYPVNIKCYRHGHNRIGSAFPIAEC